MYSPSSVSHSRASGAVTFPCDPSAGIQSYRGGSKSYGALISICLGRDLELTVFGLCMPWAAPHLGSVCGELFQIRRTHISGLHLPCVTTSWLLLASRCLAQGWMPSRCVEQGAVMIPESKVKSSLQGTSYVGLVL